MEFSRSQAAFEDPEDLARAEEVVVGAVTRDKPGEIAAVEQVLDQLRAAIALGGTPAKWVEAERLLDKHHIKPGHGQLLVFSEFADTARWLAGRFRAEAFTTETLEGDGRPPKHVTNSSGDSWPASSKCSCQPTQGAKASTYKAPT